MIDGKAQIGLYYNFSVKMEKTTRFVVIGTSGSGKTFVARKMAEQLGVSHVELDSLFWEPNWKRAPEEVFIDRIGLAIASDGWVVDGNYRREARPSVWARAQAIVWLDLPLWRTAFQVMNRTFRQLISREELWAGNRQQLKTSFTREGIIWWALSTFRRRRRQISEAMRDPAHAHIRFVRLTSRRDVNYWLASLARDEHSGVRTRRN